MLPTVASPCSSSRRQSPTLHARANVRTSCQHYVPCLPVRALPTGGLIHIINDIRVVTESDTTYTRCGMSSAAVFGIRQPMSRVVVGRLMSVVLATGIDERARPSGCDCTGPPLHGVRRPYWRLHGISNTAASTRLTNPPPASAHKVSASSKARTCRGH